MNSYCRQAKINLKVLITLLVVTVSLGVSLVAARQIRRKILSNRDLAAGTAAFEKQDWPGAQKHFQEYLGRHPDDIEILEKYAKAAVSIRPLEANMISRVIGAYRRILQLDPSDEIAYDKLAMLYTRIGNYQELAYIAQKRIDLVASDRRAPIWLADALIGLDKLEEAKQRLDDFRKEIKPTKEACSEYVDVCLRLSEIAEKRDDSTNALLELNTAIDYCEKLLAEGDSVEALVRRARFYRTTTDIAGMSKDEALEAARADLGDATELGTDNPRIRLLLAGEWLVHGQFDQGLAVLTAVEGRLTPEVIEEHFFDEDDWTWRRFLVTGELMVGNNAIAEALALTDGVLKKLEGKRQRTRVLPFSIRMYALTGKSQEARDCLKEYLDVRYAQEGTRRTSSRAETAFLQALVAGAEGRPYEVINFLEPAVLETSHPDLWRMLAEAYSQTDQTRRSITALKTCLRFDPTDSLVSQKLVQGYLKLRDWNNAYNAASLADPNNAADMPLWLLQAEAGIYMASEGQDVETNRANLEAKSAELATLRQIDPNLIDIRILQAIVALNLDQPDQAEKTLQLAIEECEEPLRAEMQLVRYYYQAKPKRMDRAIIVCGQACERHPEVAEPWLMLSRLHVTDAANDSARNCLEKGLDHVVGSWEKRSLLIRMAMVELLHGDGVAGINRLSKIAVQDPNDIGVRSLLLKIPEVQEDQGRTQALVDELRKIEGERGLLWRIYSASLLLASDDWRSHQQEIVDLLQMCIDSDPQWSLPSLRMAELYEKLSDLKRAEDILRQAMIRNRSAVDVADRLTLLLEKQGRFSDAERVLDQVDARTKVKRTRYTRLALTSGDFSRAITELTLKVKAEDQDAESRILLARLIYRQDAADVDQALTYLNEAKAIAPDSMPLAAARAVILRAEGRTEEAQAVLDERVAQTDIFDAYALRGAYLAQEGSFEEAEKDFEKLKTFADQGVRGYLLLAQFYVNNQKFDEVVQTLEAGLKAHPGDLNLQRVQMKFLILPTPVRDRAKALDILAVLEGQVPDDPELLKYRALQQLGESTPPTPQSLTTARNNLEKAVKLEPTMVEAHLLLVGIALAQEEPEKARDYAIRALGFNSGKAALLLARSRAELELKNTQMAIELVHLVLEQDPNNAKARDAIVMLALEEKDRGLLEEARELLEVAVGSNPADEELLLSYARVLVDLKRPQAAIPALRAYCQSEPGSSSFAALLTLTDLYRLTGDMQEANQWIELAESMAPDRQDVVHARFLWLAAQKRFEELLPISEKYLNAEEQNPKMLVTAGTILVEMDSTELRNQGMLLLEHAVTQWPESTEAKMSLAAALYKAGNTERAGEMYRELFTQDPENVRVLNDLAWILQERDRNVEAEEYANRGLDIAQDDDERIVLLDTRGTILSNLDRLAEAKSDFETLVQLLPADSTQLAPTLLKLGRVLVKLDDRIQAKKCLQDALGIDQKNSVFTPEERLEITKYLEMP